MSFPTDPLPFACFSHESPENIEVTQEFLQVVLPILFEHECPLDGEKTPNGKILHLTSKGVLVVPGQIWRDVQNLVQEL